MPSFSEVSTPKDIPSDLLEYLEKTVTRWIPGIKYPQYYKIMEDNPVITNLVEFLESPIIAVDRENLQDIELTLENISPELEEGDLLKGSIPSLDNFKNDHHRYRRLRKRVVELCSPFEGLLKTNKLKKGNLTKVFISLSILLDDYPNLHREFDIKISKILLQVDHKFFEEFSGKFPDSVDDFNQIMQLPIYEHLNSDQKITFVKNLNTLIIAVLNIFAQQSPDVV